MAQATTAAPGQQLTFFARVKAELKHLFVHVPGWEASAAATLTYMAPIVETIVALADPAAAPVVTALIEKIQSAMAAAAVVIKAAGPKPTLVTYLNAINTDMTQVETAAQITDPNTTAKLNVIVATLTGEVNAILQELGSANA